MNSKHAVVGGGVAAAAALGLALFAATQDRPSPASGARAERSPTPRRIEPRARAPEVVSAESPASESTAVAVRPASSGTLAVEVFALSFEGLHVTAAWNDGDEPRTVEATLDGAGRAALDLACPAAGAAVQVSAEDAQGAVAQGRAYVRPGVTARLRLRFVPRIRLQATEAVEPETLVVTGYAPFHGVSAFPTHVESWTPLRATSDVTFEARGHLVLHARCTPAGAEPDAGPWRWAEAVVDLEAAQGQVVGLEFVPGARVDVQASLPPSLEDRALEVTLCCDRCREAETCRTLHQRPDPTREPSAPGLWLAPRRYELSVACADPEFPAQVQALDLSPGEARSVTVDFARQGAAAGILLPPSATELLVTVYAPPGTSVHAQGRALEVRGLGPDQVAEFVVLGEDLGAHLTVPAGASSPVSLQPPGALALSLLGARQGIQVDVDYARATPLEDASEVQVSVLPQGAECVEPLTPCDPEGFYTSDLEGQFGKSAAQETYRLLPGRHRVTVYESTQDPQTEAWTRRELESFEVTIEPGETLRLERRVPE